MKLYRFLARSYHGDRVIEPGEEVLLSDDVVPGPHMVDVAAEAAAIARGAAPVELPVLPDHPPVFRRDLAHSAGMPIDEPPLLPSAAPEDAAPPEVVVAAEAAPPPV